MDALPLQAAKSSVNTLATYIRKQNAESCSQVGKWQRLTRYPRDPVHNRGGHVVKLHQQHLLACFSPLQKSGYPAAALQHSHAGNQATELSPASALWIVQQPPADRRAGIAFPAAFPSISLQSWGCEGNSIYMLSDNFSRKTGVCNKTNPSILHVQSLDHIVFNIVDVSLESLNAHWESTCKLICYYIGILTATKKHPAFPLKWCSFFQHLL